VQGKRAQKALRFLAGLAIFFVSILAFLLFTYMALQSYENSRYEAAAHSGKYLIPAPAPLPRFTIADPYACPGNYYRVQMHAHTNRSDGTLAPAAVAATYRHDGYSALFLTDHDRVTAGDGLGGPDFLVLTGEEDTLLRPLGRQLLRLGILASSPRGVLLAPAHPSSAGSAGTRRWYIEDLLAHPEYGLIEIANPKSDRRRDLMLWHILLARRGSGNPVWGIAVDDSHHGSNGSGWVWVKAEALTGEAIISALRRGSFYATRGPAVEFSVREGSIMAKAARGQWIRFIDQEQRVVAVVRGTEGSYKPVGNEGFVRIEVEAGGLTAYSQPFWLR